MSEIERRVVREARSMTREDVLKKALARQITWSQAASILGISDRQVRRLRSAYEHGGRRALEDRRAKPRRKRISQQTIRELCTLRRDLYRDFSIRHFYEFATGKHGLVISYTKVRAVLQDAGLALKAPGRGKYRRRRERRPMVGMMLHLDGSTHRWIAGLPHQDLVVMLDDATSEILFARFFEQEGVASTMWALKHVLTTRGRFGELYTDRGTHFCNTRVAGQGPDAIQQGPVPSVLRALGIRQIWAYSPQARGRSERAFGTIQGRLPQELRAAGVKTYDEANRYLEEHFIASYNARFSVKPAQSESAFTPLVGVDIELLLSVRKERLVANDNTVSFKKRWLQLPSSPERAHYARCTVTVHEFVGGDLGVSYQGKLLARYTTGGEMKVVGRRRQRKKQVALGIPPNTGSVPLWTVGGHP
jgi:transposase